MSCAEAPSPKAPSETNGTLYRYSYLRQAGYSILRLNYFYFYYYSYPSTL
jgi:hypothetical protein